LELAFSIAETFGVTIVEVFDYEMVEEEKKGKKG
jgi:DNA-binding XRE family transcriptional regulator